MVGARGLFFFFFNDTATTEIYTLSLHDALPIWQYLLYALVALHLLAILFYAWRGRGLVRAMVTGDKHLPEPLPSSRDTAASRLLALVLALVAGAAAWWVQQLGGAF